MEERRNYYEMLYEFIDKIAGTERPKFDPVDNKGRKGIYAVELWKRYGEVAETTESKITSEEEKKIYEDMKLCMTDKVLREKEADNMRKKQEPKLNNIVLLLKENFEEGQELYISESRIKTIKESLWLSESTVKNAFMENGFKLIDRPKTKEIIKKNTWEAIIKKDMQELRNYRKQYVWIESIHNLYDLAAYYNKDEQNIDTYYDKTTEELRDIMIKASESMAEHNGTYFTSLKSLYNQGHTKIFTDEKNRKAYDDFLKVQKLSNLFLLLKELPKEMKRDAYFAEGCIKKIMKQFPDYEIALALYNEKAGIATTEPYEPDNGDFDVVCGNCKAFTKIKYGSKKEECKCNTCGTALYTNCKKCQAVIPAISEVCPSCGFRMSEAKQIEKYIALAKNAIVACDIGEARKQLIFAEQANPEDERLKELRVQIQQAVTVWEKPLADIRGFINRRYFMMAEKQLADFKTKYPKVNVSELQESISVELAKADKLFSMIEIGDDSCGKCFDILDKVKDYQKAMDYIKSRVPKKPNGLQLDVSTETNKITLKWNGTGERGVTYSLLRKEGAKPNSRNDGKLIMQQQLQNQYVDNEAEAGKVYFYAVYASRLDTYSELEHSDEAVLFSELQLKNVNRQAVDSACIMSWELPKNSRGVRVLRCDSGSVQCEPTGNTTVVAECAVSAYEDKNVVNGHNYEYRLQCVYINNNKTVYSKGITFRMTPDSKPQRVELLNINVKKENTVQINWRQEENSTGFLVLYNVKNGVNVSEGATYHISDMDKIGTRFATIPNMEARTYECPIRKNTGYRIIAFAIKGEYGTASNLLNFSTFEKCTVEKGATKVLGGDLVLQLKTPLPEGLSAVWYAVTTKNREEEAAPWCGVENISKMQAISAKAYSQDGMIRIRKVPEKDLYVSVIGEYQKDDMSYYSETAKMRLSNKAKSAIRYRLVWGMFHKKKNVKLIVECDRIENLPELKLCTHKSQRVPMSAEDPNTVVLCTIPEGTGNIVNGHMEALISNEIWNLAVKGNEIRLFLPDESYMEYKMEPGIDSLKIP